jgi:hypothetical protein
MDLSDHITDTYNYNFIYELLYLAKNPKGILTSIKVNGVYLNLVKHVYMFKLPLEITL